MKKKVMIKKSTLIVIAVVFSLIIYAAGLLSGLSFSKFAEEKFEKKTKEEVKFLVEYVDKLDNELQSIQLQEAFINSLDQVNRCEFSDQYFVELNKDLSYYWAVLPSRLEDYEQSSSPSEEYLALKEEYTKFSLRAWIIAKNNYNTCSTDIIPILYFYSKNCADCVKQGENFDEVKGFLKAENKSLVVFTVDSDYDEPALEMIKRYYGIESVPALILNEEVLQGRLFEQNEILLRLKESALVGR